MSETPQSASGWGHDEEMDQVGKTKNFNRSIRFEQLRVVTSPMYLAGSRSGSPIFPAWGHRAAVVKTVLGSQFGVGGIHHPF